MTDTASAPSVPIATPSTPLSAVASVRWGSLVAGTGLLLMMVFAGVGMALAVGGPLAGTSAAAVLDAEGGVRAGVGALMLVALLDVAVAWGLYRVLAPVHSGLAALAAAIRVGYAGIFLVAIAHLSAAVETATTHAGDPGRGAGFAAGVATFEHVWSAGLTLFGVHLVLVGALAWRSGYVPAIVGVLVAVAGIGYTADGLLAVLLGAGAPQLSVFLFGGEVLLAGWLLWRGRRIGETGRLRSAG